MGGWVLWWNGKTGMAYFGGIHALLLKPPQVPGLDFADLDLCVMYANYPDVTRIRELATPERDMSRPEVEAVINLLAKWGGGSIALLCG